MRYFVNDEIWNADLSEIIEDSPLATNGPVHLEEKMLFQWFHRTEILLTDSILMTIQYVIILLISF